MTIEFEMHVTSRLANFPRRFGKRVRAAGGRFSECRGYNDTRFVHLPIDCLSIAEDILEAALGNFGRATVIIRGVPGTPEEIVHYVRRPKSVNDASIGQRLRMIRDLAIAMFNEHQEKERERVARELAERPGTLREERARLVKRIIDIDLELAELERKEARTA